MRCHLVDSLEWTYPDSNVPDKPVTALSVDVARGGTAACQVLVAEAAGSVRVRVEADGGQVFRLVDVPVEVNTGPVGFIEKPDGKRNRHVTRRAPFRVYDAMAPLRGPAPPGAAAIRAFRAQVAVSRSARPGRRQWRIVVSDARQSLALTLSANVFPVRVPPVSGASLKYTNWFSLGNMADRHGLAPWSGPHWRMIRRYAELMVRGRQNMFWLTMGDVFETAARRPRLNVSRLERLVKVFTGAGMYYIEGPHFAHRLNGDWNATRFAVATAPKIPATGPEGVRHVAIIARQLQAQIDRHDWRGRWVQHVADEPSDGNADDYRILAGMIRKHMPGVRIIEATMCKSVVGSVDIWVPKNCDYECDREFFAGQQALGDEVWHYTCCFPGGPYLNRLLDGELLRPCLLHWGNARYDLPGFLHWGLNHYKPDQDPFRQNVVDHGGGNSLPAGDTHVVYPGADGPWSSMRFEAQREGAEDYELLRILRQKAPRRAAAVLRKVIRSFKEYTLDVKVFRKARRELLSALR